MAVNPQTWSVVTENVTDLTMEIEERFRQMLAAMRVVTKPVQHKAVCTWSLGVPSDLLTGPEELFTAKVGGGLLSCKPDHHGWLTIIR